MKRPVHSALVSVYEKAGIVEFCRSLHEAGVRLISTGGTARALQDNGIPVQPVEDLTGFPEMLDGRVKTLHPGVHGGILADRTRPEHMQTIAAHNIQPIDLVVINLYPFEATVAQPGATYAEAIEKIDIGGPSMIRSAAKNHEAVTVLTDPADYPAVLDEIRSGGTTSATRRRLAANAFALTSGYDAAITNYLTEKLRERAGQEPDADQEEEALPESLMLRLERTAELRYGENPHQHGALYRLPGRAAGIAALEQLSGKELSYLNLFDVNGALELAWEFTEQPVAVIVKHASPCGAAQAETTRDAYRLALECDSVSAFGGIVALNRTLDLATAQFMVENGTFLEVVAAPDVDPEAAELLREKKKNLRVLKVPTPPPPAGLQEPQLRSVRGGVLVQTTDVGHLDIADARCVSRREPTAEERAALAFAWKVVKHVKSNGIAICQGMQAVGLGGGQTDRKTAVRAAIARAGDRAHGAVLASDAYFPFADGPQEAARAGVTAIVQPGGSIRDAEVIAFADETNLAMLFTGHRHFRH